MGACWGRATNTDDWRADGGWCSGVSAFRTIKNGNIYLKRLDWVVVGLITVIAPAIIGFGIGAGIALFMQVGLLPVAFHRFFGLLMSQLGLRS